MKIQTSSIRRSDKEKIDAKAYWQQPGTQPLEYRSRSHYVNAILKFITESGARKILEFGCGSGRNLEQINQKLSDQHHDLPTHLRGIDTNADSITFGRKKFGSNLDLILGDEKALADEPNAYYDLVYTVSVLDHFPDPTPTVRELLSKTRRYAIFLEPINPLERGISAKAEKISTRWDLRKSDEATPYTYFHPYLSIFDEIDANVIIDIPMPTHQAKVGPFYRLYLVEKNNFDPSSSCHVNNPTELFEGMIQEAIVTLSSSLQREYFKVTKLTKKIQVAEKSILEAKSELHQMTRQVASLKQEAITQKTVNDDALQVAEKNILEAKSELHQMTRQVASLKQEAITQKTVNDDALLNVLTELQRLVSLNEATSKVNFLESRNSLSRRLGDLLIEGSQSPRSIFSGIGNLYKIWQESRISFLPELGGVSFDRVIAAYAAGGFDQVEKLMIQTSVLGSIQANAYTVLARHLRKNHQLVDAAEAASRAYEADPRLFRRKWLVFRLIEASRVLEADALLATLPADTQFSISETAAADEVRGRADDERLIAFRKKPKTNNDLNSQLKSASYYVEKCRMEGVDAVAQEVRSACTPTQQSALECIRVAKELHGAGFPEAEYPLTRIAKELHASPQILRAFFWAAQRGRKFADACDVIHEIERRLGSNISAGEAERLNRMKASPAYQLTVLRSVEPKKAPVLESIQNRLCYVLHNSLPYSSGGYATRSEGVAGGMTQVGFDVIVLTRPGFPLDIKPELSPEKVALSEEIDGIQYMRMLSPLRKNKSMLDYVLDAADSLEEKLRELKPEVVIAASNHVTGLPALIATRRLGLKFIYEVRGLWEITRASRENSFQDTAAFAVQSLLEATVCKEADWVFTLTEPMREELIARGVDADKIDLLPNSCDYNRFLPKAKDSLLADHLKIPIHVPVIGYIGTFVGYEGLDDLVSACALLKKQGFEFRLLLIGNENASSQDRGLITEQLREIATAGGFSDWLIMPGRVPNKEVESYYSLIDIAPFPRKPWLVCEMVSPMKPLEAFAMEKAVVVSSVRALQNMVKNEETGLVFEKGNVNSLSDVLGRLISDTTLRRFLGKNARAWIKEGRTWTETTKIIASCVKKFRK